MNTPKHASRHHFIAASRAAGFSLDGRPGVGASEPAPSNRHAAITMLATVSKSLLFISVGTDTIGHADRMPTLNMKIGEVHVMHCDGMNTSLCEVVLSSAIGDVPG